MVEDNQNTTKDKILVVDDEEISLEILSEMVSSLGKEVEVASSGEEAYALYVSKPCFYYKAILLDQNMVGMSGIETAMKMRLSKRDDAKTLDIVVASGELFLEDTIEYKEAVVTDILPKPFDKDKLAEIFAKFGKL